MSFNFRGFDTHRHYNHVFPTFSLNHTHVSDDAINDGLWSGTSVDTREAIRRELEKEIIRERILAEEIERWRREILEAEVRRELRIEHELMAAVPRIRGFQSSLGLGLGQPPPTRRYQFQERCDGSGCNRREISGFEAVPSQWRPSSPKIQTFTVDGSNVYKRDIIGLGQPSGSKAPPAPLKEEHFSGKKHLPVREKITKGRKKGKKHQKPS